MNSDELPQLQEALQRLFPEVEVVVTTASHRKRLKISIDNMALREEDRLRFLFLSPETMDYTALTWQEWLHRATTTLRARLS
jgi:hypothetical protein